jgi:PleD family two-component response regulator
VGVLESRLARLDDLACSYPFVRIETSTPLAPMAGSHNNACWASFLRLEAKVRPMSQEKVLIVEDEENERTGLAELVSAWGYRAETAKDGAEGFEKVSSWAPSIVVTDLKMPLMGP